MSYYRGDYYRGDYYRGDPGFLGSIGKAVGGALKSVARVAAPVLGTVIGGPLGTIAGGAISRALGGGGGASPATAALPALGPVMSSPVPAWSTPMVQGRVSPLGTIGVCGVGMRLKKDGGCTNRRRPRMNFGNARAAGRAISRIKGARALLARIERSLPKSRIKSTGKKCGCK